MSAANDRPPKPPSKGDSGSHKPTVSSGTITSFQSSSARVVDGAVRLSQKYSLQRNSSSRSSSLRPRPRCKLKRKHPPWIKSKQEQDEEKLTPVQLLLHRCQEEAWSEFAHSFFCEIFDDNRALLDVFECLYYMGVARSVMECAARLIVDDAQEDDLACLAQYLAYGVTRVPTPVGISQRIVLLQIILSFREQLRGKLIPDYRVDVLSVDPVALWHFVMGTEEVEGEERVSFYEEKMENYSSFVWLDSNDEYYFWCWELRALCLSILARDQEQQALVRSTADELARTVGMAAITVELGISQSTQLVCEGMGQGVEWIKEKLGSPVKAGHLTGDLDMDGEQVVIVDDRDSEVSSTMTSVLFASSTENDFVQEVPTACEDATFQSSTGVSTSTFGTKRSKDVIVHDTYTSYSRTARQATEEAKETASTYISHIKNVGVQKMDEAANKSREWASQNVDPNTQHWAYLDAASKVALASLGAVGVVGESVIQNSHVLLDHTTSVTTDLINHKYGPTAARVFEDVSTAVTNVSRTVTQVAILVSPHSWAKAMVKHTGKEKLRQQHEQEQILRRQREAVSQERFGKDDAKTASDENNLDQPPLEQVDSLSEEKKKGPS